MRTSNIEIIFDLNVYTRDHFSQRAQTEVTLKFKFLSLCHAHNLQFLFTTDEEAPASKRMVFYDKLSTTGYGIYV